MRVSGTTERSSAVRKVLEASVRLEGRRRQVAKNCSGMFSMESCWLCGSEASNHGATESGRSSQGSGTTCEIFGLSARRPVHRLVCSGADGLEAMRLRLRCTLRPRTAPGVRSASAMHVRNLAGRSKVHKHSSHDAPQTVVTMVMPMSASMVLVFRRP